MTKPIVEIFSTAANSGFAFQSEEEVRGEQGDRRGGMGGWRKGAESPKLNHSISQCLKLQHVSIMLSHPDLLHKIL